MISELRNRMKEYEPLGREIVLLEYARIRKLDIIVCGQHANVMELCRVIENESLSVRYVCTEQREKKDEYRRVSFEEILKMSPDQFILLFAESPYGYSRKKYLADSLKSGPKGIVKLIKTVKDTRHIERILLGKNIKFGYMVNHFRAYCDWIEYYSEHEKEIEVFKELLADEESKAVLDEIVRAVCQNDIYHYHEIKNKYKYFADHENKPIYHHLENETWVNCGSSCGDTIFRFISAGYKFKKIYAFEGSKKIFRVLKKNLRLIQGDYAGDIITLNCMCGGKGKNDADLIRLFENEKITLMNCDIEGAELQFLQGVEQIIKKDKPVLAISLYHKKEDITTIPAYIYSCNPEYRFFLRKYVSWRGDLLQINELVLYAVPECRVYRDKMDCR